MTTTDENDSRKTPSGPAILAQPCTWDEVQAASKSLILSASGWRKVFSPNGEEEDPTPHVGAANYILAAYMAQAMVDEFPNISRRPCLGAVLALGRDSRPSGALLADAMARIFLAAHMKVRCLAICAAPEIMAYSRLHSEISCFTYVSASHNPIGYNGVKFGLNEGGVLAASHVQILAERFKALVANPESFEQILSSLRSIPESRMASLNRDSGKNKAAALSRYREFADMVCSNQNDAIQRSQVIAQFKIALARRPIGIVGDLNGSARGASIDSDWFGSLGVMTHFINAEPGNIAHGIVPEGSNLDHCAAELELQWKKDKRFLFGYMPDCDGDRGNLVWMNQKSGKAQLLQAQEVFALSCLGELAFLQWSGVVSYDEKGRAQQKVAIAVNDATSNRIEDIAKAFDAYVFRCEVGEANVVNLASSLRKKGYIVRILGEGSNGGTITHPAAVRDPMNTIACLLKLLAIRDDQQKLGIFHLWCNKLRIPYNDDFGLAEILDSLPSYSTTEVSESRAVCEIGNVEHARLKARYEELFKSAWESRKEELEKRLGAKTWEEINYEGTNEFRGVGRNFRTGKERGGFKIIFKDEKGLAQAFIWMRGSGTEPVFRVLADVRGKKADDEKWLLDWHKSVIAEAVKK